MPTTGPDRLALYALPIKTPRLTLRPLRPADAGALQPLLAERDVAEMTLRIPFPYPDGGAARWIDDRTAAMARGEELTLAIERNEVPGAIGAAGIIPCDGLTAEIGFWLGKPFWGNGLMTEAVGGLIAHGFVQMALRALVGAAMPANRASIRVLAKNGFAPAGRERRDAPARGGAVELELHRLTAAAWRAANPLPVVLVVAVALIDIDGRVLIARRPEGKVMAGLWEFPGGKVRDGESPEAALIRELDEELGIDVTENCLAPFTFASHAYDDFHLLMPLYVCRVWRGQVTPREGQALKWVRPMRLRDYPMPPADVPLIAMLRDFL